MSFSRLRSVRLGRGGLEDVISHRIVRSTTLFCTPISTGSVMAPKLTGHRKRDKIMEFFHLRPTRTPPPTQSSTDGIAATQPTPAPLPPPQLAGKTEPTSTKPEKVFAKGKSFKKDMAILSIAYTLQKNSELSSLIQLIVLIQNNDSEGQVMSAIHHAYRSPTVLPFSLPKFSKPALSSAFSLHLLPMPSVQKPHGRLQRSASKNSLIVYRPDCSECLYPSFRTVAKLKTIQIEGDGKSLDELMTMIREDIESIKVSLDIPVCPIRHHNIHTSFSLQS